MKKFPATLAALALTCFAIGILGSDIGLPAFVTAKRTGLFLVTLAILWIPLNKVKVPIASYTPVWILAGIVFWGAISLLTSEACLDKGVLTITAWLLTAYASLAFAVIFAWIFPEEKNWFINWMALFGGIIPLFVLAAIAVNYGPGIFFRLWVLRYTLDEISIGLNRFLNGLFFLSAIPMAIILGIIACRRSIYFICLAGMAAFAFLALVTVSRQTLGVISGYLLFLLGFGVLHDSLSGAGSTISRKKQWLLTFFALLMLSIMVWSLSRQEVAFFDIQHRMVDRTEEQLTEGQIRIEMARIAWGLFLRNPIFGVGPGGFPDHPENYPARYPHNGYIEVMVEYGFIPLLVLIVGIVISLFKAWRHRLEAYSRGNGDLLKCAFSFNLIFSVWLMNFNDLAQEYFFWAFVVLMTTLRYIPERCQPGLTEDD